jgi:hypothetical protein
VDSELDRSVFAERAFWAACVLAVLGGVGPLVAAAGHTNRIAGVVFPFAGAAVAMAVIALTYRRGRAFSALVYFVGGLAIAYGLLLVLAIPLRLAVEGTCPPAPARCAAGFELQLTGAESTGLSIAVAFGVMSLLAGFAGLAIVYRQRGGHVAPAGKPVWPARPPEKAAPAVEAKLAEDEAAAKDLPPATKDSDAKPDSEPGPELSDDPAPASNPPAD